MAGLVPAIHVFVAQGSKTWMPGTRPGMTNVGQLDLAYFSPALNGGSLPGGTVCSAIASIMATMT
jgi:hypothetical protein